MTTLCDKCQAYLFSLAQSSPCLGPSNQFPTSCGGNINFGGSELCQIWSVPAAASLFINSLSFLFLSENRAFVQSATLSQYLIITELCKLAWLAREGELNI